mmetsp:Transcript_70611/g.114721  ORF Transcript_70611/g.114721 Transcript_70611/m.114721 type:complete len:222 (+) Transcript_70611:153-818(+)
MNWTSDLSYSVTVRAPAGSNPVRLQPSTEPARILAGIRDSAGVPLQSYDKARFRTWEDIKDEGRRSPRDYKQGDTQVMYVGIGYIRDENATVRAPIQEIKASSPPRSALSMPQVVPRVALPLTDTESTFMREYTGAETITPVATRQSPSAQYRYGTRSPQRSVEESLHSKQISDYKQIGTGSIEGIRSREGTRSPAQGGAEVSRVTSISPPDRITQPMYLF